jgi:hypothetical protein
LLKLLLCDRAQIGRFRNYGAASATAKATSEYASMFIFWKKTLLSDRVYSDPHCIHTGPGRFTLTPVLKEAFRKEGKPRNRTLWRASRGIRSCCIEDSADPTPRVTWWLFFEKDFQQAQVGRDQAEVARLHAYYPRLKEDLAKVILRPSLAEDALWFCMMSLVQDPRIGESPQQRRARLLGEARRTLDEKIRPWWENERRYWQDRAEKAEAARRAPPRDHHQADGGTAAPGPRKATDSTPWFFRELGVSWPCTEKDVKDAWRRGVKVRHPDQGGSSPAFIAFKRAYDEALEFLRMSAAA